jgi:hypothetical protein
MKLKFTHGWFVKVSGKHERYEPLRGAELSRWDPPIDPMGAIKAWFYDFNDGDYAQSEGPFATLEEALDHAKANIEIEKDEEAA